MTDLNASPSDARSQQVRGAVGEALFAVSSALNVAAVVIGALMCAAWLHSADVYGHPDFPGRYLFALLPLLAAAGTLRLYARSMGQNPS